MLKISFEEFKVLINSYSNFNIEVLNDLYQKYGSLIIKEYFLKYYRSLVDESEIDTFMDKFSVYFQQNELSDEYENAFDNLGDSFFEEEKKRINSTVGFLLSVASTHPLMSFEEEKKYGQDIKVAKEKLTIIKKQYEVDEHLNEKEIISLYPVLELEKIFLSINDENDINVLKTIKKLPYSLNDASIFRNDIEMIRKYLNLSKNGIPSVETLRNNFKTFNFDGVTPLSKNEYYFQMKLLIDYVIARYNFYNRNLKLVISVAKRYYGKLPFEDVIQTGNLSLIKAIEKFDVEKGFKFSTYATWWIRQGITRDIADTADVIRKPVHIIEKVFKYERFVTNFEKVNHRKPSLSECAKHLNLSEEEILNIRKAATMVSSLDCPIVHNGDSDSELGCFIADDSINIEDSVLNSEFYKHLLLEMKKNLTARENDVLLDRAGLNAEHRALTLEEIGVKYDVTRERIRQIESKALRKIRHKVKNPYINL